MRILVTISTSKADKWKARNADTGRSIISQLRHKAMSILREECDAGNSDVTVELLSIPEDIG